MEIFVFCGWWFSNQLDIVSETHFSCDTCDRGLWLAILNSLLCPETDRNIRIGKQGYVVYFTDKKWYFDVSFLTSSACQKLFWHWEKLNFLNKWISETFFYWVCFIRDKAVRGLVLLDCRLRLLESYFCIIFSNKRLYLSFSGFSNLLNASARFFCTLSFAQSRKILSFRNWNWRWPHLSRYRNQNLERVTTTFTDGGQHKVLQAQYVD